MKKRFFPAIIAALFCLALAGQIWAADISMDVNCTMKPGGSEEAAINKFKEIVEERSGGRMKVKIFMSGQLGSENAVLELLKIGQTQLSVTGGNFRNMYAKAYDPITIPFVMNSWEMVDEYLAGPMGDKIKEGAAKEGGLIDFGPQKRAAREMTSNREIRTPEDMKGLKLRLPAVPIWVDVWKELGALPTVIPAPEIYLAMKTGQVEAHENSLVSPYSRKMWEVQKYIINTNHIYWPWHWVGSKVWFDKLSAEDQKLIREAIDEARKFGGQSEDELDTFYAAELKKNGMIFIDPDVKAIRAKAAPAIQRALDELAPEVKKEIERLYTKY